MEIRWVFLELFPVPRLHTIGLSGNRVVPSITKNFTSSNCFVCGAAASVGCLLSVLRMPFDFYHAVCDDEWLVLAASRDVGYICCSLFGMLAPACLCGRGEITRRLNNHFLREDCFTKWVKVNQDIISRTAIFLIVKVQASEG